MSAVQGKWRTLVLQGTVGLLAAFGAGLLSAAVLTAAVLALSGS